jgi:DNA-binding transcriptional regulator YiaG
MDIMEESYGYEMGVAGLSYSLQYREEGMPAKGQKKPLAERFWSKLDKRGPDECWPWLGCKCRGYGQILHENGKYIGAHVAALIVAGRYIEGMDVLHNCNNPECVNERHLRNGTHQENMQDAIRAGTFRHRPQGKGEKHSLHILTECDVKQIRRWASVGLSHGEVAKAFGVARKTVSKVVSRETWDHVT